ncbi:hypothetical protein HZ996_08960 [Cryomorphaceae bacterium]|nr:hypothetical protein HZ996_08960 [Cryomorphaceae bacterium]
MNAPRATLILLSLLILVSCAPKNQEQSSQGITISEIRLTEEGYRIYLNDEEFYVKGAGLEYGNMEALAAHGANSFRTWRTKNKKRTGIETLDAADELGLKVAMGLHLGLERHGFNYDDERAVAKQLKRVESEVKALKDHPALFLWVIGNELNHHSENPKVWDAVNDVAKMIHELDGNHLCTTPLAGMKPEVVRLVQERAPELDFISVQLYGEIEILPELIEESGYTGPLLVTEWGATGYWEVAKTEWGAPIENTSSIKADLYRSRFEKSIAGQSEQVMGSFAFLWGQKQERTPTWFGMFMPDGQESEAVDAMHQIWKSSWPENRSPRLHDFKLDGKDPEENIRLKKGETYIAKASVSDFDKDPLNFRWEILRESTSKATGGDPEPVPERIENLISLPADSVTQLTAPPESGAYRLFVYIEDGQGHVAHANIPFWVEAD